MFRKLYDAVNINYLATSSNSDRLRDVKATQCNAPSFGEFTPVRLWRIDNF